MCKDTAFTGGFEDYGELEHFHGGWLDVLFSNSAVRKAYVFLINYNPRNEETILTLLRVDE